MKINKVLGLALVGMLSISMVGCNKQKVLQKEIDIFKALNNQEENIEGLNIIKHRDWYSYEITIDADIYHNFKNDVKEIGLKEAREKYGISELTEEMISASEKQGGFDIFCAIFTDEDYNPTGEDIDPCETLVLSVYNKEVENDMFK